MDNVYKLLTSIVVFVCSLGFTDGKEWCSLTRYCESPNHCCGSDRCCSSIWGAGTIGGTISGIAFLIIVVACCIGCRRRRNGPIYRQLAVATPGVTVVNLGQDNMAGMQYLPPTQYPPTGQNPPPKGVYPPSQGTYPPPQGAYPSPQGVYPPSHGAYPSSQGAYQPPPEYTQ